MRRALWVALIVFLVVAGLGLYWLYKQRSPFLIKSAAAVLDSLLEGQNIVSYAMEVDVSSGEVPLTVQTEMVVAAGDEGRSYILFFLNPGLQVEEAFFNDQKVLLREFSLLRILLLPQPLKGGERGRLKLRYKGSLDLLGFGDGYIEKKGYFLRKEALWYPVDFQGYFTVDIKLRSPSRWTLVRMGELVKEEVVGGRRRAHWVWGLPLNGFSLAGGDHRVEEWHEEGVYYRLYMPKNFNLLNGQLLQGAVGFHRLFKEWYGDDDLKNLSFLLTPDELRGYNHGLGFISLADENLFTLAHELSHNWWGGIVSPRWLKVRGDGGLWLAEGFAEFSALAESLEEAEKEEARVLLARESYPLKAHRAIENLSTFDNLGALDHIKKVEMLLYSKGSLVLLALKAVMGEQEFLRTVRGFLEKYRYRMVGSRDFESFVVERQGKAFTSFFDSWIRGVEGVDLAVDKVEQKGKNRSFVTTLYVENRGRGAVDRRVEVLLDTDKGEIREKRILKKGGQNQWRFKTLSKVKAVAIDPFGEVPDGNRDNNYWSR